MGSTSPPRPPLLGPSPDVHGTFILPKQAVVTLICTRSSQVRRRNPESPSLGFVASGIRHRCLRSTCQFGRTPFAWSHFRATDRARGVDRWPRRLDSTGRDRPGVISEIGGENTCTRCASTVATNGQRFQRMVPRRRASRRRFRFGDVGLSGGTATSIVAMEMLCSDCGDPECCCADLPTREGGGGESQAS
jgi:hypothetical protein